MPNGDPCLARIREIRVARQHVERRCVESKGAVGDRNADEGAEDALRDRVEVAQIVSGTIAEVALGDHVAAYCHENALDVAQARVLSNGGLDRRGELSHSRAEPY